MSSLLRRHFINALCMNRKIICTVSQFDIKLLLVTKPVICSVRHRFIYRPITPKEGQHPSALHPGSAIDNAADFIESFLDGKNEMTGAEWDDFKAELSHQFALITEDNFGPIIMDSLIFLKKLDLAHGFIKYLEERKPLPNYLVYLKYISLCSKSHRLLEEGLILGTLEKVRHFVDKYPILDMKTAEYMIQGLCATSKWRESFDYLNKLANKPSLGIRSALACAAIRNKDEKLAWEILTKMMKAGEAPSEKVVEEFFLVALEMLPKNPARSTDYVNKVLQFMQLKDIIVDEKTVKLIEKYFASHPSKWITSYARVNRKGECEACGSSLKLLDLTNDEFRYLKEEFLNRVVKKSDVYINSSPREFQYYLDFINRYKPFHVVVDGLNAAYTYPSYPKSKYNLANQLLKIVKKLAGSSRKILVMGRKHMRSWPPVPMKKMSEISKVFYTDNISQDDPFLLYAAFASGPHTLFFSLDLMRDHISRLEDPYTIALFKRWQLSHQIYVTCSEDYDIKFIPPLAYSIHVQGRMEDGWHIPYDDQVDLDPYEELNNWLCIKRNLEI